MRLNRPAALLVALLTLAPWGYFVFFFTRVMPKLPNSSQPGSTIRPVLTRFQHALSSPHGRNGIGAGFDGLLHRSFVAKQPVPADKKALWAVVLFLGNLLAMPVY